MDKLAVFARQKVKPGPERGGGVLTTRVKAKDLKPGDLYLPMLGLRVVREDGTYILGRGGELERPWAVKRLVRAKDTEMIIVVLEGLDGQFGTITPHPDQLLTVDREGRES